MLKLRTKKNRLIQTLILIISMMLFVIPAYATSVPDIEVKYTKLSNNAFEAKFSSTSSNVVFFVSQDVAGFKDDTYVTQYNAISGDTYIVKKTALSSIKDVKVKACVGQKCSVEVVLKEFKQLNREHSANTRLPNAWQAIIDEYRVILAGISGMGLLTAILVFIINMVKLGNAPNHPKQRREFMLNIVACLVTTALLGATTLILTIFYSVIFL